MISRRRPSSSHYSPWYAFQGPTRVGIILFLMLAAPAAAQEIDTQQPPDIRSPAKVVTATFIGSPGHEWLSTGGVLPDGNVLLCGVSLDAEITLMGVKARVLGQDAPPLPKIKGWRRLGGASTGEVALPSLETDLGGSVEDELGDLLLSRKEIEARKKRKAKEKKALQAIPKDFRWEQENTIERATVYRKLSWTDPESMGFIGVFTPDLQRIITLRRLPRGAGSITSAAVAPDGTVYIAGGATSRIEKLSSDVDALKAITSVRKPHKFVTPLAYVAKLNPDLSSVAWVRTVPNDITGPRVRWLQSGEIALINPDVRVFSPSGALVRSLKISRSRWPGSTSINPVNGRMVKGGDFLTKTGREPYRTPYFFIYNTDGSIELELFRWRGPFAGLDSLRLVADAQVLRTTHDHLGHLTVVSRSHGGNAVCLRYPYDIDRFMPNTLGALAMNSPGYIVKMNKDYDVVASGVWADPGFIDSLSYGADGSVAWIGKGRGKLVSAVSDKAVGDKWLVVGSPRLDAIRFSSTVVGCGQRVVVGGGPKVEDWGIATGTANGRPLLMFLSGAVAEHKTAKDSFKTPLKNPVQSEFAGGVMDGYVVLLDLSPGPQPPRKRETHDGPKPVKRAEPPLLPAEGQKWTLGGESYFNVQLTLRETPDGELWPRFYHGRADEGGRFIYTTDPAGDTNAGFALRTHHLEQGDGDQSRRLFGTRLGYYHKEKGKDARGRTIREYVLDPQIDFTITGMTPWEVLEARRESSKRITIKQQPTCTVKGVLHFGDRDIPVDDATCTAYFSIPRKVDDTVPGIKPNKAGLNIVFTVTGSELGFAGELARKRIRVRWACTAYSAVNYKGAGLEEVDLPEVGEPKDDEVDLDLGIDLDL